MICRGVSDWDWVRDSSLLAPRFLLLNTLSSHASQADFHLKNRITVDIILEIDVSYHPRGK
jgi:hypothetical protein